MKKIIVSVVMFFIIICLIIYKDKDETHSIILKNGNETMNMRDYMCNVILGEMNDYNSIEALKAFAIITRTNIINVAINNKKSEINIEDIHMKYDKRLKKSKLIESKQNKILQAIKETKNEIILYKGKIVYLPYHRISSGQTKNRIVSSNKIIPYLKIADCKEDRENINYLRIKYIDCNKKYNIDKIKQQCKKQGINYDVEQIGNRLRVVSQGEGHDYGMSLCNADKMAIDGKSYVEILNKFYKDIDIVRIY